MAIIRFPYIKREGAKDTIEEYEYNYKRFFEDRIMLCKTTKGWLNYLERKHKELDIEVPNDQTFRSRVNRGVRANGEEKLKTLFRGYGNGYLEEVANLTADFNKKSGPRHLVYYKYMPSINLNFKEEEKDFFGEIIEFQKQKKYSFDIDTNKVGTKSFLKEQRPDFFKGMDDVFDKADELYSSYRDKGDYYLFIHNMKQSEEKSHCVVKLFPTTFWEYKPKITPPQFYEII